VRGVASSSERRSRWQAAQDGYFSPTRASRGGSGARSRRITRRRPSTPRQCSCWTCSSRPTRWTSARKRPRTSTRSFRNINWDPVLKRIEAARNDQPPPNEDPSSTTDIPSLSVEELAAQIAADFGSASAWRREFVGTAQSLAGGSGWVLLTYSRRQKRFSNQIATDHTQAAVDAAPVLVLDMYEHAYQMDFGVNTTAYIDTFFRNINWVAVLKRIEAVRNDQALPNEDPSSTKDVPSLSVEELTAPTASTSGAT